MFPCYIGGPVDLFEASEFWWWWRPATPKNPTDPSGALDMEITMSIHHHFDGLNMWGIALSPLARKSWKKLQRRRFVAFAHWRRSGWAWMPHNGSLQNFRNAPKRRLRNCWWTAISIRTGVCGSNIDHLKIYWKILVFSETVIYHIPIYLML